MAKNKVKSKRGSAGPRRRRAANETRLANMNKAARLSEKPEPTLHDMLADEGLELHTGKNDDGEDIVWTEPLGGAVDDTSGPVATTRDLFQLLDETQKLDDICKMKLADASLLKQVRQHHEQIDALLHSGGNMPTAELLERHEELAKIVTRAYLAQEPPELLPETDRPLKHSGWQEVVDLQNDMIRFWSSPFGRAYGRAWGAAMMGASEANNDMAKVPGWSSDKMMWAKELARIERAKLMMADPIYINDEVQQLVASSIDEWPATHLRREDVFPSFYGFAVFPRPFVVIDDQGKRVAFRAIAWQPLGPDGAIEFEPNVLNVTPEEYSGLFITGYAHDEDPDDYPIMQMVKEEREKLNVPITAPPIMSLSYATPWHFEQSYAMDENDPDKSSPLPIDLTGSGLERFCRILRVMWTLAQQKITVTPRTQLPRAQRKRAERSDLQADVLVVKLRQVSATKKDGDETNPVDWQCRWRVRTHWRDQWYPSEQRNKPILIFSYMKGPDDKPLKIRPFRAYEFRR